MNEQVMKRSTWWRWSGAFLGIAILVIVTFRYVDRPLARMIAAYIPLHHVIAKAPVKFPAMIILAGVAILIALGQLSLRKTVTRWVAAGSLAGLALIWSAALTEFCLKFLFGRTSPRAFVQSGQYGFHWFHVGGEFGSFPSGHAEQAAAIMSVLWIFYPLWRWIYVAAMALLSLALVAGEWHFLSDIIAGAYVGAAAGTVTVSIWKTVSNDARNLLGGDDRDVKQLPVS